MERFLICQTAFSHFFTRQVWTTHLQYGYFRIINSVLPLFNRLTWALRLRTHFNSLSGQSRFSPVHETGMNIERTVGFCSSDQFRVSPVNQTSVNVMIIEIFFSSDQFRVPPSPPPPQHTHTFIQHTWCKVCTVLYLILGIFWDLAFFLVYTVLCYSCSPDIASTCTKIKLLWHNILLFWATLCVPHPIYKRLC